ncbi:Ypt/Rab-GAP domain of gyp1p superfamily protein [Actinidia rufa]|uniref:Ypt/Rab-GAP domain of gyp1p superfamily protein n=1 Tax=Actinidia rufa TaxID=165716 RepID=A0A7J0H3T6_9ERIC|nr:Ypt/Rab-GAP domain of gyp1p superfamily protein [Actinidia rufa]
MRNSTAVEVDSRFAIRARMPRRCTQDPFQAQGVLRRIQKGGVHPSIKAVVWEFLLGCFDPNSTFDERNELRQRRREQYEVWKAECQKMVPIIGSGKFLTAPIITDDGQPINDPSTNSDLGDNSEALFNNDTGLDKKVIQWKLNLPQIGLDVIRTDRALIFYESDMNQAKLWNILAVYAWVDNSIGYVQGMNDICSPMVILMENEADAFWCFERAMRKLCFRFSEDPLTLMVHSQIAIE